MFIKIVTALMRFTESVPKSHYSIEEGELVIRVPLSEENAQLFRDAQEMFAPL